MCNAPAVDAAVPAASFGCFQPGNVKHTCQPTASVVGFPVPSFFCPKSPEWGRHIPGYVI